METQKRKRSNKSERPANEDASKPISEEVLAPPQIHVDISDYMAIRAALDDAVVYYATTSLGLEEDTRISTFKLVAGYTSVAIALTAQFYPLPLKTHRWVLGICVVSYWLIQLAMLWIHAYKYPNVILLTRRAATVPPLKIETSMKPYATEYTVSVYGEKKSTPISSKLTPLGEVTLEITDFFDTNGLLLRDALEAKLKQVFKFVK